MTSEKHVEDIKKVFDREGEFRLCHLKKHDDVISKSTFYRHFNSVEEAVKLASIPYDAYEKIELICGRCGRTEKRPPSFINKYNGKVKSHCKNCEEEKISVECWNCDSIFEKRRVHFENRERHFCNRKCYNDFVKKPQPSGAYSGEWQEVREKVINAFDSKCFCCSMTNAEHQDVHSQGLHVHHITPMSKYRNAGISDAKAHKSASLVALCIECHMKTEKGNQSIIGIKVVNANE
jgi:hypothetical protein